MAKVQRTNPVALDAAISKHQDWLWSTVKIGGVAISGWESYDRVYKNYHNATGLIPEHFTGGKDYKEVFYNDNFDLTSFYVADDTSEMQTGDGFITVSLIVQANLAELYPAIAHRADEELRNLFTYAANTFFSFDNFALESIETSIERVYREFYQNDIKLDDMSEKHCFRMNFRVKYTPECCTNC